MIDRPEQWMRLDSRGLLAQLADFIVQFRAAAELGAAWTAELDPTPIRYIVYCGLGGSAIGGDLLNSILGERLKVPLWVNRQDSLPAHLGPEALLIVSSYSGNTAETLSVYELACSRGLPVVCVTSGGELERRARARQQPVLKLPAGLLPRMALVHSTVAIQAGLVHIRLAGDSEGEIAALLDLAPAWLSAWGPDSPVQANLAKQLALFALGRALSIYGSAGGSDIVAKRWACQFSENAKHFARSGSLPEVAHNEVEGWVHPSKPLQDMGVVVMSGASESEFARRQAERMIELLQRRDIPCLRVDLEGNSRLAQIWSGVLLGDYASLYLAFLNGEDPAPIPAIESIKSRPAEVALDLRGSR